MLKIAITGSTGLIGSRIVELLSDKFEFIPLSHSSVDITDKNSVTKALNTIGFDLLLHLAAYTNVDKAETENKLAYAINVTGTKNLFETTLELGKKFIYLSTDFVFSGNNPPYSEESIPDPIGYYGQTKFEAEEILKDKAMIVRLSYPYRAVFDKKRDFVRTIKSLLEQKKELKMITDSQSVPTFIDDIAYALEYLMNNYSSTIYHIVGSQCLSPFEAGKMIAQKFGLDQNLIKPVTYEEYFTGKAKRPQFSNIVSKKNTFYKMKTFEEGLQNF